MKLKPEILTHPNIPKPLHEVNPRTIMGKTAWDYLRKKIYKKYDYHCIACGVHKTEAERFKWLEAHEYYEINYEKGSVEIESIEPLCHFCHNFIHSGRLAMIVGAEKSKEETVAILEHGLYILFQNNLKAFPGTLELAEELGACTFDVKPYLLPEVIAKWEDWRLLWDGKKYPPKYKTYDEWLERYTKA